MIVSKLSRKRLVTTLAASAGVGILRFPAGAAEYNFKFANEARPGHHNIVRLTEAAKQILDDTNGRVDIQIFPSSQLGGAVEILSQVRLGAVAFTSSLDTFLGNLTPVGAISNTPYAFGSQKIGLAAMAGPLGVYRRNALSKVGLHAFEVSWDQDFRQLLCEQRPMRTPADLKGFKIATSGPVEALLFKAFNATPVQISVPEIYTGLQTHLVDATSSPFAGIRDLKFFEAAKYLSVTNHIWTSTTMLANPDIFGKLPANIQDIITRRVNEAANRSNDDAAGMHGSIEGELVKLGIIVTHPDPEIFRKFLQQSTLYPGLRDLYGAEPWKLLEQAIGKQLS